MQLIIILFCFLCVVFSYYQQKNIYNPMTLFYSYWLIVIIFASLELYGVYSTSQKAYFLIALGLFSFAYGYLVRLKKQPLKTVNKTSSNYVVRYKLFITINLIMIAFLLLRVYDLIQLLNAGYTWWDIRLMVTATEKNMALWGGSDLNLYFYTYIVSPFVYLAAPTAIVDFLILKKSRLFVITTIIYVVLFAIVTVSRNILIFSIIYFIFTIIIYKKQFKLPRVVMKNIKKVPLVIVSLIVGVASITLLRKEDAVFLKEAYVYLTGAIPSLSIRLEEPISELRTYGFLSIRGFTRLFFITLNNLGLDYPEVYLRAEDIMDNLEIFIPIGEDINMNAYATLFYNFYIDGGIVGVILLSATLGYICRRAYESVKYNINIRNTVFYLLIIQQLLFSVARIYTVFPTRALPFLLILLMFTKVKTQKSSKKTFDSVRL